MPRKARWRAGLTSHTLVVTEEQKVHASQNTDGDLELGAIEAQVPIISHLGGERDACESPIKVVVWISFNRISLYHTDRTSRERGKRRGKEREITQGQKKNDRKTIHAMGPRTGLKGRPRELTVRVHRGP